MAGVGQGIREEPLTIRAVGHAIDHMPITRQLVGVIIVAGLASVFENMDARLVGFALPAITKDFGLRPEIVGLIGASTMAGMTVGSFLWGWIADRSGRRLAFVLTVLMFALFSGFTAAAFSVGFLVGIRFVTGIGLGGAIPVDASILIEFAPARIRGYSGGVLPVAFPLGNLAASLLALLIIPRFGWRALFLVGVLPALLTVWVRRNVPESPRWLTNRGRFGECRKALKYLGVTDEGLEQSCSAVANEPPPPVLPRPAFLDLFTRGLRRSTAHTWIIWALPSMGAWGLTVWSPSFFTKLYGQSIKAALVYAFYIVLASAGGRLTSYLCLDHVGRKPLIIAGCSMSAVSALLITQFPHNVTFFACAMAGYVFFIDMSMCASSVYTPEVYPLHIRALGTASAMGVGRIGGSIGPLLIGAFVGSGHVQWIWILLGGASILTVLATLWLGTETRRQNLEQLTRAATEGAAQSRS